MAAGFVNPTVPNQDVWFRDFSVKADATSPKDPDARTAQECIPVETIEFYRQLAVYNKALPGGKYEIKSYGKYGITENKYVCDKY